MSNRRAATLKLIGSKKIKTEKNENRREREREKGKKKEKIGHRRICV